MNKIKIKLFLTLAGIIIPSLFLLFPPAVKAASSTSSLDNYAEYFYNRYSLNFDADGLAYSAPDYGIIDFKEPTIAREWVSLASYYKYRVEAGDKKAKEILRESILKAVADLKSRTAGARSFNDSQAFFLIIRMNENIPGLLTEAEKDEVLNLAANNLEAEILAKDTENRALIGGAHWQYVDNYLYQQGKINSSQKKHFDGLIKNKIDQGIKESIDSDGWYFENNHKDFSVHYQAVSAFMLLVYGDLTQQDSYKKLAGKMYFDLKKISFNNGMVEAKLGKRPVGLGAQFYLAMALLGKYFNDDDYRVYLFYGSGSRFFSDKAHPNRLEYHSTIEFSQPDYHDDYSFSNIAELGLTIDKLKNLPTNYKYFFSQPIKKSNDKYFKIVNEGKIIFINKLKLALGSRGNWSRLFKK
jgi:hypothetical protein